MERKYLLYKACVGFTCQAPIFAIFCLSQGLDFRGLMQLSLAFAAARIACDVPSGIFADRVGRKAAILVRVGLEIVSVLLLFERRFTASSLLAGAACAFSSGAESALVYEGCGRDFSRIFGRAASWGALSAALAALAGGALASVGFDWVYALRLGALAAAGALAAGFVEAPRPAVRAAGPAVRVPGRRLARALAFAGIVGAVQVAALQLQQPFLRGAGVPLEVLGTLYVLFLGVTAAGARCSHRLRDPLRIVALGSAAGFLVMAAAPGLWGVAGILLLKFVHGISLPSLGRELNDRAPSGARAASLSLRSLFEGGALVLAAPLLGWMADRAGLPVAFSVASALVVPSLLFVEAPCAVSDGSPARA